VHLRQVGQELLVDQLDGTSLSEIVKYRIDSCTVKLDYSNEPPQDRGKMIVITVNNGV
jgi:hypothetical protein